MQHPILKTAKHIRVKPLSVGDRQAIRIPAVRVRPLTQIIQRPKPISQLAKGPQHTKQQVQIRPKVAPSYTISKYKGIGKGKILVMVGNGPSHKMAQLDCLKGLPKIEIMSINKPDERLWPTTYWLFCDNSQQSRHRDLWEAYNRPVFNTPSVKDEKANTVRIRSLHKFGFSDDLTSGMHIGSSSVYAAMQLAQWMDYDRVYIFGCLPDGEKILTGRGLVAIDQLNNDDIIWSKVGFVQFQGKSRREYHGNLYNIITNYNNIPLRVTGEHPVLVLREGTEQFIPANELLVNDQCIVPIENEIIDKSELSRLFWWLAGVYAAEGYIKRTNSYDYVTLCIGHHEHRFKRKIQYACKLLFGCKVTYDGRNRTAQELIINNNNFAIMVQQYIGKGSHTKFIGAELFVIDPSKQVAFISGYLHGDGSIFRRKCSEYHECTFSTASESLADGVQKILLRLGVISSLVRSKRPSGFDRKNTGQFGIRHHVNICGDQINILGRLLNKRMLGSSVCPLHGRIVGSNLLVKIRKIEITWFDGYVNNINVDNSHTYGSHLIMTHNCDMGSVDGKLYPWGHNPDVSDHVREKRFATEALNYQWAADNLTEAQRSRFVFCSQFNKWPFLQKFESTTYQAAIQTLIRLGIEQA
jgi:hypothetical protein